ncbi:ParB/RepB/Spo0J family partition protein [[Clostridium] innocuum]|uniref:ParB/RepB/Spo0J family partition protein n=1 Tax=Clostridium innocuum TaxID=1522 RepID=UPI003A4DCFFB
MTEIIKNIEISSLVPFENHPFKERSGLEQEELLESIKETEFLEPITVRFLSEGKYEIISGHRRVEACKKLGLSKIPATIKELSKDEAIVAMVDFNMHREHLLYSEKAFAYKMKLEALKHQGKTYGQVVHKSRDNISDTESGRQIQRYIRLTHLIPELLKMVDEERIAFTPAVELSYLPENEQKKLVAEIEYADATPSLSQAQRLRKFSEQGRLSVDTIFAVLSEEKPNQKEQVRFLTEDIRKYFPQNYSNKDMQNTIIRLLEKWQRQRERNAREER